MIDWKRSLRKSTSKSSNIIILSFEKKRKSVKAFRLHEKGQSGYGVATATKWENWITKEKILMFRTCIFSLWLYYFSETYRYRHVLLYTYVGFFWYVWCRNDTLFHPYQTRRQRKQKCQKSHGMRNCSSKLSRCVFIKKGLKITVLEIFVKMSQMNFW